MNPPYNLAHRFVLRALTLARQKVAIISRLDFLASQKRYELFKGTPVSRVLVLSTRPSMPPGGTDIPAKGGQHDYCWIIWDKTAPRMPTPTIDWVLKPDD